MFESTKGYFQTIRYAKITINQNGKSLFIESERAYTNKSYSKIEVRGIRKWEGKGIKIPEGSRKLIIYLDKNKIRIDRAG